MERHAIAHLVSPLVAVIGLAGPLAAQSPSEELGVGVELVLAVDVSRSIDPAEQVIQRKGYAAAFRSPQIQKAILFGDWNRIAVTYVEWAGVGSQTVVIPWTVIDSAEAADDFAARIESGTAGAVSRTSISGAIDFAAGLFDGNGFTGGRRVIDISGDGPNNQGPPVTDARDAAVGRGITINGLPLLTATNGDPYGRWSTIPDLDRYYSECVIGGVGAFAVPVANWDQFAAAVRWKLALEVAGLRPPPLDAVVTVQSTPPSDCMIGERLWQERQRSWSE